MEVGWWLVLGNTDADQLLAWQKMEDIGGKTTVEMTFTSPDKSGKNISSQRYSKIEKLITED